MRALLLSLLLLLSACTHNEAPQSGSAMDAAVVQQEGDPNANLTEIIVSEPAGIAEHASPPPRRISETVSAKPAEAAFVSAEAGASRMVIRNAELQLTVSSPDSAALAITRITETRGGYVTESRQWREGDALRAFLTLRVPADRLSETLTAIRNVAVRVENESVNGQDVTAEYTDLSAQLTNLETAEAELRELLSTTRERSQKASDILEVYTQLTHIRGEVERIKGRMQYLAQMTAYSTIRVALFRDQIAEPLVAKGWRPLVAAREAGRQLVATLQQGVDVAIWVAVYVAPLMALLLLPLYALIRLLRTWRPRLRTPLRDEAAA